MRRLFLSVMIWIVEYDIARLADQLTSMRNDLTSLQQRRVELYTERMQVESGRD